MKGGLTYTSCNQAVFGVLSEGWTGRPDWVRLSGGHGAGDGEERARSFSHSAESFSQTTDERHGCCTDPRADWSAAFPLFRRKYVLLRLYDDPRLGAWQRVPPVGGSHEVELTNTEPSRQQETFLVEYRLVHRVGSKDPLTLEPCRKPRTTPTPARALQASRQSEALIYRLIRWNSSYPLLLLTKASKHGLVY